MSQQELLARVVAVLDAQGVPYMITGSFASSMQGAPRATHDVQTWAARLGVMQLWQRSQHEAEPLP